MATDAGPDATGWGVTVLEVRNDLEDLLVGQLATESLGVHVAPAGPGRCRIEIYLDGPEAAEALEARAESILRRQGVDRSTVLVETRRQSDDRWVQRYQERLRPIELGRGFLVVPGTAEVPSGSRQRIALSPGGAFGTGEHPTTRMCAAAVESRAGLGERWIDLGCGTGLLAVILHYLGARTVLGLDNDAEAVAVARTVVEANGAANSVELRLGSTAEAGRKSWDGIVANIASSFFLTESASFARLLRPGGIAVLSGFLLDDVPEILDAMVQVEMREIGRDRCDEWALLVLERGVAS